jgi:primosomal protein N' (replication factor Y)
MQNYNFADILLPLPLKSTYTYSIPENLKKELKVGIRVLVNFGKRKIYTGIIIKCHNNKPEFEFKPIISIVDETPFVNEKQLKMWQWMANYYCCKMGEVLNAAIPNNLIPSSETKFFYNPDYEEEIKLNSIESKIINILKNNKQLSIKEISEFIDIKNPVKTLEFLENKKIISTDQNLKNTYKPLLKSIITFDINSLKTNASAYEKILKQNSKQKQIVEYLTNLCKEQKSDYIEIDEKIVLTECCALKSSLKSIESKKILEQKQVPVSRLAQFNNTELPNSFQLTPEQLRASDEILNSFRISKPALLHGVTSSGKTEIYIKLIDQTLAENKQVLYLLPEIALTSQIIFRLKKYFGDQIGVFHSKYSTTIRAEIYRNVVNNKLKIILGTRSAIFLPFSDLGLIVVDEEHETSYKQFDPDPRYNARDMAVVLAKIHNANIILGSATPSIETYYNSITNKYSLIELPERFGNISLPQIITADLKDAYKRKIMNGHFHPILSSSIQEALDKDEQIILFQNRRGYSPFLECKDCGWVPYCKNCNVSLTYHKFENQLVCHYCGEKINVPHKCSTCGSTKLSTKGFGTEKIEDEVKILFKNAKIGRLDYDTANSRKRFEKIIKDFENHNLDILIGTQMVTKGLDFEKVNLVGILNADNMLNFPDFRAFERSFQLMSQVSGRAGRRDKQGKVIIQTFNPQHVIIQQVVNNDYKSMFDRQITERKLFRYPPIWNFIVLKLKNKDKEKLNKAASLLAEMLKKELFERVKGPQEPLINKINNVYIQTIHVRFEKSVSLVKIKAYITDKCAQINSHKDFGTLFIEIDVDPV